MASSNDEIRKIVPLQNQYLKYDLDSLESKKMSFEEEPKESFQDDERAALTGSQVEFLDPVSQPQRSRHVYRMLSILTKSVMVLLAIYGVIAIILDASNMIRATKSRNSNELCDCGNSVAEAKAMGCKYSALAAAWLPPQCRDDELEEEFERSGPHGAWKYWHDANGTQEIKPEELGVLSDVRGYYWSTQRWHITHCVYYWLKLQRKSKTGTMMEPRYDSERHIRHCLKVMLVPLDLDFISTSQGASLTSGID